MWSHFVKYTIIQVTLVGLGNTQIIPDRNVRAKREIGDHYNDDHCLEHFSVEASTIIRTKDSRENGAVFINETEVATLSRCLHLCCSTPLCNVAVFGERSSCYLFDCGSPEAFKCQFTSSDDFASAVLDLDRHRFDLSAAERQRDHSDQLELLRNQKAESEQDVVERIVQDDCGQWQFSCNSGDCIAIYDVCNGIPQCRDASDEDKEFCKTQTTQPPPPTTQHIHARPDMNPVDVQSAFQHRGGLQLPDQALRRPFQDYSNPQDIYGQGLGQGMVRPGFQFPPPNQNQVGLFNQYPAQFQPQYILPPPQQQQLQPQPPLQQQQQPQQPQQQQQQLSTTMATTKQTTTTTTTTTKETTTSISEMERYEESLIAEVQDELRPMEMPGIAAFTLVVGVAITTFIVVVVVCRIRRGRISFRRRLTHEADGDFLVNGMYL